VLSLILFSWQLSLAVFGLRFLIQGLVFYKVMRKLKEQDLFVWWWLLDIWMFFYYIIFMPALWKRPRKTWN
jgi:hypothetical protein